MDSNVCIFGKRVWVYSRKESRFPQKVQLIFISDCNKGTELDEE